MTLSKQFNQGDVVDAELEVVDEDKKKYRSNMGTRADRVAELFRKFAFRDSDSLRIVIEGGNEVFDRELASLAEGKIKVVNGIPVRKDKPHFNGDDYHATITFDDGTEASWLKTSGKRRHPNKFPANISPAHKAAAAKVLGKCADQLEAFEVRDEATGKHYLLIEEKGALQELIETIEKVRGSDSGLCKGGLA